MVSVLALAVFLFLGILNAGLGCTDLNYCSGHGTCNTELNICHCTDGYDLNLFYF